MIKKGSVRTDIMEEKHTFTYKKLVVPMSMRSIYWRYFGFPATDDGDILTKVKIVCILCKSQICYNRNTSNLRMHLQNKHAEQLLELEAANPPKKSTLESKDKRNHKKMVKSEPGIGNSYIYTTCADGTVQVEGDIQFITDPNITIQNIDEVNSSQNVRVVLKGNSSSNGQNVAIILPDENSDSCHIQNVDGKTISDAIAEFIILDLQLPDVVEGKGFQRLIATLRSPCEIPSKTKLEEELIPKIYDTFKDSLMCIISCLNSEVGLSVEEWTLASGEPYISLSIHYQSPSETAMVTKVLCTIHCSPDMTASHWSQLFENIFSEWNIKTRKVTAVVTATTRIEVIGALVDKGLTLVPCLLHCLQMCTTACFEQPEVAIILTKCRATISAIAGSANASSVLKLQEQLSQLEENVLKLDYPRVWMSTYVMLEQFLCRRSIMSVVTHNIENLDSEFLMLTEEEWKIIEDLVMVLEPFKVTIMTLSEEKTPLISLLNPLLWQLNTSHLKVKDSDSVTAKAFKESLADNLCERYSDTAVNQLLQIATSLDPRFKTLPCSNEEASRMPLNTMLTELIKEELEDGNFSNMETPNKKSRISGMEFLLGDLCQPKTEQTVESKADLELYQYHSESSAPLDCCPLQWWKKVGAKCPNLAKLAARYSCVPACAMPPQRIPLESQLLFDSRRAVLSPEIVDKLLFLNGDHNV